MRPCARPPPRSIAGLLSSNRSGDTSQTQVQCQEAPEGKGWSRTLSVAEKSLAGVVWEEAG